MSKNELEVLKVADLRQICKKKGLCYSTHSRSLTKKELIEAILKADEENAQREEKIEEAKSVAVKEKENNASDKEAYLLGVKVGMLIAFKIGEDKVQTAAVKNVSFSKRRLKLVTQYGKEYIISFDDVLWVRTGKRWPRGIYELLKNQNKK